MGKFLNEPLSSENASTDRDREFDYSRHDFEAVRSLLQSLTGIQLSTSKDSMVYSRLARRIRSLRLSSFKVYLHYIESHQEEIEHFINALTTNLTSFFREPHHFDILKEYLLKHPDVRTIWCSASSTGEEPYSIAMVVAETFGRFDVPVKIIATDIDSNVLQTAANGVYASERISGLSDARCKQFFHRGRGANDGRVKIVPELQRMVEFRRLNLLDDEWFFDEQVDIIFCRNVMIYFDKDTQVNILERMVDLLPDHGMYVAGHSENFNNLTHLVRSRGKTTYQPADRSVTRFIKEHLGGAQ